MKHLDRKMIQLDDIASRIDVSIDRLREYRTAPISAAVSGKIDVWKEVA